MARRVWQVTFVLASAAASACTAVLGLDPPALDPCANGGCTDAADDAPSHDAESGARDAGAEGAAALGIRCGGGSYPETTCTGQTPACCQIVTDAGATYACRATGACEGYEIACASNADCPGNNVCCHYGAHVKCGGTTSCTDTELVCEPDGAADQCPTGWACKVPLVVNGVTTPYTTCGP